MRWAGPHCALVASLLAACGSAPSAPSRSPATEAQNPVVRVELRVPSDPDARMQVELSGRFGPDETRLRPAPAAVGAYRPAPFGRFFHELAAFDANGAPLTIETRDGVHVVTGALARFTYEVDGRAGEQALDDLAVSNHRRDGYTFVSGYATFMIIEGSEQRAHELTLVLPAGWRAATALENVTGRSSTERAATLSELHDQHAGLPPSWHSAVALEAARGATQTFRAPNVLELLDEPLALGTAFRSARVDDAVSPGYVHLYGGEADSSSQLATMADAYRAAVRGAEAIGLRPMTRPYHLFVELLPAAPGRRLGWAMEHDHSTAMMYEEGRLTEANARFTFHVVHEVLHAWIPRRLYTTSLHPRAQLEATATPHVWLAEGFAQYLAYVATARSGAIPRDDVLRMMLQRFVTPYEGSAPPEPISLEQHSRLICAGDHDHWAWHYGAGGLLALHLDHLMRSGGDGTRGLPEAFAALLENAPPEGIPDDALEARLSEATGLDLTPVFERHIRGAEPLDVDAIISVAGITRADGELIVRDDPDHAARRFRELAF